MTLELTVKPVEPTVHDAPGQPAVWHLEVTGGWRAYVVENRGGGYHLEHLFPTVSPNFDTITEAVSEWLRLHREEAKASADRELALADAWDALLARHERGAA